jgi:hypothetical protein
MAPSQEDHADALGCYQSGNTTNVGMAPNQHVENSTSTPSQRKNTPMLLVVTKVAIRKIS